MNYKVTKGTVGPFAEGQVITDEDLAAHPNLGGVKRLRDRLHVIEDDYDRPDYGKPDAGKPARAEEISADDGPRPNVHGRRHAGKS